MRGESPKRIQWLADFMTRSPAFHELQPLGNDQGRFLLAKPGEFYLLYCTDPRPHTVPLAGNRPYKLDLVDPWAMTVTPVGTANAGDFTVTAPKPDIAYRFTPYQPGEKLRPEAKITASVTAGVPPLRVQFTSAGGLVHWDFGDETTSEERDPTHIFRKPGLYSVTLTVRDADGGSARAFRQIAVDRNVGEPIVRLGFPSGDTPPLKTHGTARRGEGGSVQLPDGAPWGWVQAGEAALEDVRGLRSFTIMGWLKPASLQVGSGGNRILFCLNRDHSGIDLVCHADGRLRLAVNQWPDAIKNDSSPGKLQVGKWTLFAVTYDATQSGGNVNWYFGEALDAPGDPALALDRQTSYHAGDVGAEPGPLAIGNFNQTLHGHGLDRQFRGEIRSLQLFGSRVDGRGALTRQLILTHAE